MHLRSIFCLAGLVLGMASAQAATASAEVTVDNVYGLYSGTPSALTLLGSDADWTSAESRSFTVNAGDYVYVAAWDQGDAQGFQGVVNIGSTSLPTNTTNWVVTVIPAASLPGWSSAANVVPNLATLRSVLAGASWVSVGASAAHNSSPWGVVVSDPNSQWIWNDTLNAVSNSDGSLVVFRTVSPIVSAVPEPGTSTSMLLGLGVVSLLWYRRRGAMAGV